MIDYLLFILTLFLIFFTGYEYYTSGGIENSLILWAGFAAYRIISKALK